MSFLRNAAIALIALGILLAVVGFVMNAAMQTPDANIGAGLLVVFGLPIAGVGLVGLLLWALLRRRS